MSTSTTSNSTLIPNDTVSASSTSSSSSSMTPFSVSLPKIGQKETVLKMLQTPQFYRIHSEITGEISSGYPKKITKSQLVTPAKIGSFSIPQSKANALRMTTLRGPDAAAFTVAKNLQYKDGDNPLIYLSRSLAKKFCIALDPGITFPIAQKRVWDSEFYLFWDPKNTKLFLCNSRGPPPVASSVENLRTMIKALSKPSRPPVGILVENEIFPSPNTEDLYLNCASLGKSNIAIACQIDGLNKQGNLVELKTFPSHISDPVNIDDIIQCILGDVVELWKVPTKFNRRNYTNNAGQAKKYLVQDLWKKHKSRINLLFTGIDTILQDIVSHVSGFSTPVVFQASFSAFTKSIKFQPSDITETLVQDLLPDEIILKHGLLIPYIWEYFQVEETE